MAAVFTQVVGTSYSQRSESLTRMCVTHRSSPRPADHTSDVIFMPQGRPMGFNKFYVGVVSCSDVQTITLIATRTIRVTRASDTVGDHIKMF